MGFFSDFKEDLSQAVNELIPEDEMEGAQEDKAAGLEDFDADELDDADDLQALLDRIDSIEITDEEQDEEEEEPVQDEPAAASVPEQGAAPAEPDTQKQPEAVIPANPAAAQAEEKIETKTEEESMNEKLREAELEDNIVEEAVLGVSEGETKDSSAGFDFDDAEENRSVVDETAVITAGMTINGDISSQGSVDVIGTIIGNVDILGKLNITGSIQGNSKASEIFAENAKIVGEVVSEGSVKIGQSSVIIGNITAKGAIIAGAVKGDIDVHGSVILDTTAIVMGNIKSKSVQINNGAVIEGMCSQCYADVSPTSFFDEFKKSKVK